MELQSIILALLAGGIVIAIAYYVIFGRAKQQTSTELVSRSQQGVSAYPDWMEDDSASDTFAATEGDQSRQAKNVVSFLGALLGVLGRNIDEELKQIRKKTLYAGIRSPDAPIYYLAYQYIASPLLLLLALVFLLSGPENPNRAMDMVLGLILAVFALFGHKLYIKNRIDKRQKELTRSFPDMLDLMLVCIESGLALDAAIAKVCNELGAAHPLLTEELNRTRMELSVVSDRSKAFYALGERTGIPAMKALAAALIQSEKFGTSMGDTLRVLSDDYRQSRLLLAEEKAARLPALITVPLITMLLPAMFIIILTPAILSIIAQGGLFGGE
jgi:pilus assembly protein TadC